ncbi:13215_t:CDS:2 [Dentiscutata heterogama]|uniref:13215_t:CDS:1 n=2 Tax=Gigasporaceae TaxID=36753 RepID=A0ACA9KT03_9GLOM|nr:13215_t:CDS:2 [Dentiscutata heterogama]
MDQSESNQSNQNHHEYIQDNHESDYNYENDQSYQYDYESDQSNQELTLSNKNKKLKTVTKSKPAFKNSWLNEFRWLQFDKISQRMFCKYCKCYNKSNAFGNLMLLEKTVNKELEQLTEQNKNHIIGIAKIVYTLVQQDIPLAKLQYMVQLFRELESSFIVDGAVTYENEISGREFAFAISNVIKAEIWKELSEAVSFGIMIDKTLDQSDATTITTKLIRLFQSYDIIDKLVAFASDGASVMIGCKNGVAQKLSQICPYIVYNHYIAHRLALACKDSQKQIDYFNNAETIIRDLRLKKLKDIRWLGWYDAVKNFVKTLPAVLLQLQHDNNKVANNLYQRLCNWRLLGFFHFIFDILGHLASLNKFFQKSNLYFQDIIPIIDATTTIIQKDYLVDTLDVRNHYLGYNLQLFIDHTNPFNKQTGINYHTHLLIYNNHNFDDLFQDIYKYASTIITEIKERFPDRPLLAAMRILNPVEWSRKKEELFEFGNNELQILFDHYGTAKTINGQKFLPLIDVDSCITEWPGFKNIIFSNFLTFFLQELLPFLVRDYSDIFPNIIKLAHITNSIPFSSVDCERGFFKQNTIKTCLRTSLTTFTLDAFMRISLEGKESKEMNWDKIYHE